MELRDEPMINTQPPRVPLYQPLGEGLKIAFDACTESPFRPLVPHMVGAKELVSGIDISNNFFAAKLSADKPVFGFRNRSMLARGKMCWFRVSWCGFPG
ncbi:hypothetical protein [Burkholderia cenocepacia]|uniref:hypothetical protein n=1 Tax=Burkholderia cenocepacia TaxID=95486 RepID=UPI002012F434|nr:hypothetical protein [Burkholderia cenocepacia]